MHSSGKNKKWQFPWQGRQQSKQTIIQCQNPLQTRQSKDEKAIKNRVVVALVEPLSTLQEPKIFLPCVRALLPKRIAALLTSGWNVLARIFGLSHPNFCETCQRSAKCLAYAHQLQDRPQAGQNKY